MKRKSKKMKRKSMKEKIAKDRKVIPDPIDDRKFQENRRHQRRGKTR